MPYLLRSNGAAGMVRIRPLSAALAISRQLRVGGHRAWRTDASLSVSQIFNDSLKEIGPHLRAQLPGAAQKWCAPIVRNVGYFTFRG
jgi:hypothetical protein